MFVSAVVSLLFFASFTWWLYPRVTSYLDRRLTIPRLGPIDNFSTNKTTQNIPIHNQTKANLVNFTSTIDVVEELLRQTRSDVHAKDSLNTIISRSAPVANEFATTPNDTTTSVVEILFKCAQICEKSRHTDEAVMFRLLTSAYVNGVFIPAALEQVLATLRTHHSIKAELASSSAQALFTARILTYLPIVAFITLVISSSDMQRRLFDISTVVILTIGLGLNRLGAVWIQNSIKHSINRPVDETMLLSEHLVASLRAGCSITESIQRWQHLCPLGNKISHAITHGDRLETALSFLPQTTSGYRLAHTIISGYRDGLPLVHTMHRLTNDAQNDLRASTEVLIRQLPARLSAPLVLCILPSFLFIAVAPLIISSLGQLGPALSPAITSS